MMSKKIYVVVQVVVESVIDKDRERERETTRKLLMNSEWFERRVMVTIIERN